MKFKKKINLKFEIFSMNKNNGRIIPEKVKIKRIQKFNCGISFLINDI